tara:strand:+ start:40722 stop:41087 length:366 start_codon:yes stop_codon:yes gene_type:complete
MTSDADRFWNDMAPKYRAFHFLCPMTPGEADAEYDDAPQIPMSESDIRRMVDAATSGNVCPWNRDVTEGGLFMDTQSVEEEMLAMYREEGEVDDVTDIIEEELRKGMLRNDDSEEQDGLDG